MSSIHPFKFIIFKVSVKKNVVFKSAILTFSIRHHNLTKFDFFIFYLFSYMRWGRGDIFHVIVSGGDTGGGLE